MIGIFSIDQKTPNFIVIITASAQRTIVVRRQVGVESTEKTNNFWLFNQIKPKFGEREKTKEKFKEKK